MNPDNTPPLPQPTSHTCPHCGFGWDGPAQFCPRCGTPLNRSVQNRASTALLVAYGCGFIFLGGVGACFGLIGVSGGMDGGIFNPFSLIGFVLLAGAAFLLWKLVRGGR